MEFDLIIRNGTVIDGSGQPGVAADVGIRGDRIAAVEDLGAATAAQTMDATGKIVSPGFIDIHTHSDFTLLLDPQGEGMVRQGVTTNVIGNCSLGCYPVRGEGREALQETLTWLSAADVEWDWTDLEGYRRRFNSQGARRSTWPPWWGTPPSARRRWATTSGHRQQMSWWTCAAWSRRRWSKARSVCRSDSPTRPAGMPTRRNWSAWPRSWGGTGASTLPINEWIWRRSTRPGWRRWRLSAAPGCRPRCRTTTSGVSTFGTCSPKSSTSWTARPPAA